MRSGSHARSARDVGGTCAALPSNVGDTLLESWLDGHPAIDVRDDTSVHAVLEAIRGRANEIGLPAPSIDAAANAAAELVHDQLQSAREARVAVVRFERAGVLGLETIVVAVATPSLRSAAMISSPSTPARSTRTTATRASRALCN